MTDQNDQAFAEVVAIIRTVSPSEAIEIMAMAIAEAVNQKMNFDCAALCVHCKMIEDENPGVPAPERSRLGTDKWYHYYTDVNVLCPASPILEKSYQYFRE